MYRLPTESEWERAASGSEAGCVARRTRRLATCAVGSYGSNAAGLSDMIGNVSEWTSDCWEGNCGRRVARGGSWFDPAVSPSPRARNGNTVGHFDNGLGFRVLRTLD